MGDLAIETRQLRKVFGHRTVVHDLTLNVPRGAIVGFLGPNGAGKTTSMKMLLGLVHPTSGQAALLGAPLGDLATRQRIGFLPEHFRFHEWLRGREVLELHGRLLGLRGKVLQQQVRELLARVQLDGVMSLRVRQYSKGMQQRLGLAQALLNTPDLVFLDEPTSGLDPLGRLLVRGVVEDLKDRGVTVFLNSHLLSEVERTCTRVLFLREGRVIRDMILAGLDDGAGVDVDLRVDRIPPQILQGLTRFAERVERDQRDNCVLRVSIESHASLPDMTRWLAAQGVGLYHLAARRRSLESVFIELMEGEQGAASFEGQGGGGSVSA